MGYPFAEHLAEFAQGEGVEVGSIGKIAQNPDQSKHLETATFRIFGKDIDLVNLRSEEYASGSRIPTGVSFGTPEQDALRRDITINALFYNCHTRLVEDWTKRGLDDLRDGIVRTPLSPKDTFIDDPLRVLRCIRFASRFGFDIVPEIEEAVRDPEIKEALMSKVARERAGEELSKMVKGRDPLRSIQLITSLSLYSSLFAGIPSEVVKTFSGDPSSERDALKAALILQILLTPVNESLPSVHPILLKAVKDDATCKSRLFLGAILTPFSGSTYRDRKGKEFPVVEYVIRECLKLGSQNHFLDGIPALFSACKLLSRPDLDDERFKDPSERVAIGLLLREKTVHHIHTGSHWTSSLLFSLVQDLIQLCDDVEQGLKADEATRVIGLYNTFVERVVELGLHDTVDAKPLLDGKEICSAFGGKPGPWIGVVRDKVVNWQLENPQGTKEQCLTWLKEEHQRGNAEVDDSGRANKKPRTRA
ncbi:transfer RNA nucleotidyltransferase [Marasmius fiardii PR-910]|nr:transfer RNA nucleotidyltransferase [Marasmius fiardii PR-910]